MFVAVESRRPKGLNKSLIQTLVWTGDKAVALYSLPRSKTFYCFINSKIVYANGPNGPFLIKKQLCQLH